MVAFLFGIGIGGAGNKPPAATAASAPTTQTVTVAVPQQGAQPAVVEAPAVEAPAVAASGGPLTSLSEGTYEVGTGDGQIAPGKYKSPGPSSGSQCYYARLSSDTTTDIIANDLKQGPMTMTVQSSDKYVEINGCTFTKA